MADSETPSFDINYYSFASSVGSPLSSCDTDGFIRDFEEDPSSQLLGELQSPDSDEPISRNKRVLDPTCVPNITKRRRTLDPDPTYIPSNDDEDTDESEEAFMRTPDSSKGSAKKKRQLDPTYGPAKAEEDADGDDELSMNTPRYFKGSDKKKGTLGKRKMTHDTQVGVTSPSSDNDTSTQPPKRVKSRMKPDPRTPFTPELTDSQSEDPKEDMISTDSWGHMNSSLQPSHPLCLKEKNNLKEVMDSRCRSSSVPANNSSRSRVSSPSSLVFITNDKAKPWGHLKSPLKRSRSCGTFRDTPLVAVKLGGKEKYGVVLPTPDSKRKGAIFDISLEKAKRWADAANMPEGLWSEAEKDLFIRFAMRGFEPLLPNQWHHDFSTLPDSLFTIPEVNPEPLIQSLRGSEFYAIKSLALLFSMGGRVRDCSLLGIEPEPIVKRAIKQYIRWAMYDANQHINPVKIPVHAIYARKRGESTVKAVVKINHRLKRLANQYHNALRVPSAAKDPASPDPHIKRESPTIPIPDHEFPLLVGFVISGPMVAILTLNNDSPAEEVGRENTDSNFICQFDVGEPGQDVWNSLAIAIAVMHIRKTMIQLSGNS